MSRTTTIQSAATFNPSSFVSGSYQGITGQTNPVGKSTGQTSSYATINLTTGSRAITYAFWKFDCSSIPSNATINSVSCQARAYVSTTNANRVATRQINLYSAADTGSTKGTAQTVTNTNNGTVLTIPGGTWTRSQLDNCYIGLYGVRGTSNTGTTYYFRFYGADLIVNYTISGLEYEVSFSNSTYYITTIPSETTYVFQGGTQTIQIIGVDSINHFTITDNNTNVKSNLVQSGKRYLYTISNISADHTITLGNTGTFYDVNASSTYTGATVSPSTKKVPQGNSHNILIDVDSTRKIIVKDNGTVVNPSAPQESETSDFPTSNFVSTASTYDSLYSSSYPTSNGENSNSDSTVYTRVYANTAENSESRLVYKFNCSSIPENAIIERVTCIVRGYVSNTTYLPTRYAQLFYGYTAKGSQSTNFGTSNGTVTISNGGTWTREELDDIRVAMIVRRGNNTTSANFRFYGATLSVEYYVPAIYTISNVQANHTITVEEAPKYTVSSYAVYENSTISPQSETDYPGYNITFRIDVDDIANVIVKDNGVNVNSSLVHVTEETHSQTFIPSEFIESSGSTQNTQNGLSDTSSTTYAQTNGQSGHYLTYGFDCSSIPQNATINSVSCLAKVQHTRTTSNSGIVQLYSGNNGKGSASSFGNTITTVSLNTGTWTRDELENIKIRIGNNYDGGTTSYYTRFYGAELTVNYAVQDDYYNYTIQNVTTNHTVAVRPNKTILKLSGTWTDMKSVYVKVNGSWVKQTDFSAVFDPNGIYVLKN